MNSITEKSIDSYSNSYTNTNSISIQSISGDASSSNTSTENTSTSSDTIEISTNKASAFINTLRDASSEAELIPCANGSYMSADVALLNITEDMKIAGYNVPSFNNNCNYSSYSTYLDNVKDFLSKNSDISYSNQLIDFCDTLKERLNTYGIS
jgi:hypothetical protein